ILFLSVRGFSDYAGPNSHSRLARLPYCLPPTLNGVGILIYGLFAAQWPRPPVPLSTLQETPRDVPSKTRDQDGFATSFPVGLLRPLQHAGLARRTPGCPSSFQEGMIEKRSITLMGRTTSATVAMLLRVRAQVNGNHNRVHASLKSSRGPRGMSVAGSP